MEAQEEPSPAVVLGGILREKRLQKGLSQRDLAALTDLERSTIAYIERGARQPSLSTLLELCRALGLFPSDLLHELEEKIEFEKQIRTVK